MIRSVLIVLMLYCTLFAGVVTLDPAKTARINIVPHSSYLIETGRHYTVHTILGQLERFKPAEKGVYNFGFVEDPIWIAFELKFPPEKRLEWILRIDNPHIDEYLLYRVDGGRLTLLGNDGDRIKAIQPYESRTFWEPLHYSKKKVTYLLRIQTRGALQVPLSAELLSEAYRGESFLNLLFGLFYGMLLLLLVYNLVLYLVVRETHYLNYLVFLASYLLFQLNLDGIGREWLWPGNIWMANEALAFFIFLAAVFAFRFARFFLMLREYAPEAERVVYVSEALSMLGAIGALLLDYHTMITVAALWSAVLSWVLIYAGFKVLPHYRAARYYLMGWIVFLLATILVALNKLGVVPTYPPMLYIQQVGSLLQMILLSFALADRINMMKYDHLAALREFNEQLQVKIASKVDELRRKDQIMIQQSRQAAMGEMIENIAHQWRQPLNQLSLIQSTIFFEYQLGLLDAEKMKTYQDQSEGLMEYMTQTIDDFRNFFMPDREKAPFSVCTAVERALELIQPTLGRYRIKTALTCDDRPMAIGHENEFSQVVINLLTNAKDAMLEQSTEHPRITIHVSRQEKVTQITVCDNGGGVGEEIIDKIFDPYFTTKFKSRGTGIGLYMVKTIMEKSMHGRVSVHNSVAGACFVLELPKVGSDNEA